MRSIHRKTIALAIAGSLAFSAIPTYASNAQVNQIEKIETVYVNLTAEGKERQAIDSVWLKNSQFQPTVYDKAMLDDIMSVSASVLDSNENGKQTWTSNGDDVFYQAKTDKTLPVDIDIEYKLDGKSLKPEEIAGKSGYLELNIKLRNREYKGKLTTPFTAVGMIPLSSDVFSDVEMENGKFYSDGNTQMAVFVGFPSLDDMLDLKSEAFDPLKKLDFPDEFTLTANVKDFELDTIGIAISSEIPDMFNDMDDIEDIDENLADIREIRKAKDDLEEADPKERLKDLIRNSDKVSRSQKLVDDLFRFYDLDTAIIEEMKPYVTKENIALYDRVKADLKRFHVVDLLDNQVLRNLPKRLDAENIEKARKLLDWNDVFKEFDESRLDKFDEVLDDRKVLIDFMDDVEEIVDDARDHKEELEEFEDMVDTASDMRKILKDVNLKAMTEDLSESDLEVMVAALTKKKTAEAMAKYAGALPPAGALTPADQMRLAELMKQFAGEGGMSTTSAGAIQMVIKSGQMPPQLHAQLEMMLANKIKQEVATQINTKFRQGQMIYKRIDALDHKMRVDYGDNYLKKMRETASYLEGLKTDLDILSDEEDRIDDKIQRAKDVAKNEADIEYFEEWRDKLELARDDFDANEENIQIMRDLLDQYDQPNIKELYDNFDVLLADMDEVRPIAESFNDMMEKPANDRALHNMPHTLSVLIDLRRSIYNNRDISEDLRIATSDKVTNAAKSLLDIIDKQDEKNSLDDIEEELESLKSVLDKKDELVDLANDYDTFAGKVEDMESSVQFILKTDAIKKPEEKVEEVEVEEKAPSFFEWLGSLFS